MAPKYDSTTFVYYLREDSIEYEDNESEDKAPDSAKEMMFWYLIVLVGMLISWLLVYFCLKMLSLSNYSILF